MTTVTRLFDFPYYQLEKYNLPDALVTKYGDEWVKTSTQEYIDKSNAFSRGLLRPLQKPAVAATIRRNATRGPRSSSRRVSSAQSECR